MVVFKNTYNKYSIIDVKMCIGFSSGPYHYFLVGVFYRFSKNDNWYIFLGYNNKYGKAVI